MQILSNIIMNVLLTSPLIYPLLLLRENCLGEDLIKQQKKVINLIIYVLVINNIFIKWGYIMEYYLIFYILFIMPYCIYLSYQIAEENGLAITLFSDKHILSLKDSKVLIFGFLLIALFIGQSFINNQSDDQVLELNKENFISIRDSQNPLEELVYLAIDPASMMSHFEILMQVNLDDYEVLFSGNWKKEIRIIIEDKTFINEYILTYKRNNTNWELDGIFDSRSQNKR